MEESNSLIIEAFGLKATALGTMPVVGLLLLMAMVVAVTFSLSHRRIVSWVKRVGKPDVESPPN